MAKIQPPEPPSGISAVTIFAILVQKLRHHVSQLGALTSPHIKIISTNRLNLTLDEVLNYFLTKF